MRPARTVFGAPMTGPITPCRPPSGRRSGPTGPDADEVRLTAAGIVAAVAPADRLTEVQRAVLAPPPRSRRVRRPRGRRAASRRSSTRTAATWRTPRSTSTTPSARNLPERLTLSCAPGRTRTCGQIVRSDLLCPLSYGGNDKTVSAIFARVQVKYRTLASNGAIKVNFVSSWSDSRGTCHRPIDKQEVDVVCIYCPDTGACHYVDPKAFGISVSLRVRPSGNGQSRNVLLAEDHRGVPPAVGVRQVGTTPRAPTVS